MQNVHIIGTSHIAKESFVKIDEAFNQNPDIVCVELDAGRFQALLSGQKPSLHPKNIRLVGFQGYLFALIGYFLQKHLGAVVGVEPGADMMYAAKLAGKKQKQLFLIDRNIQVTLKRFSKAFSFREKIRMIWDIVSSPFRKQQKLSIQLTKVPKEKLVNYVLSILKQRYPSLYKVLVHERNIYMVRAIQDIAKKHAGQRVLVVVGIGHLEGMHQLLKA